MSGANGSHGKRLDLASKGLTEVSGAKFVGVVAKDPRLNHISIPAKFRNHPLIVRKFFYTVPRQLLQVVSPSESKSGFESDAQILELELALSGIAGAHDSIVGFWNGQPIRSDLLQTSPVTRDLLPNAGELSELEIKEKLRIINERLLGFHEITCAYAGWLVQNQLFLSELADLNSSCAQAMGRWGTETVGLPIPKSHRASDLKPSNEPGWPEYESAVLKFCVRWRLNGLAGPRIPIPMRPMMSGHFPVTILQQLMRAGGVFNWPDTFPLFARDQLRDMIADALQSTDSNKHLHEWQKIIASTNKAKNQFASYERQFRLQHFWKLLRERHPAAFNRRLKKLDQSFAAYLGVSEATIRNDRDTLKRNVGELWDLSGSFS